MLRTSSLGEEVAAAAAEKGTSKWHCPYGKKELRSSVR